MSEEEWCKHYVPESFLFTSESVGRGHPDKFCDQLSDAILDACLAENPESHVACECGAKDNTVMVFGEITPFPKNPYAFVEEIVNELISDIGYDVETKLDLVVKLGGQSPDITPAVEKREIDITEIGAGDQGLMYGYATDETEEMIPLSHKLSHQLLKKVDELRHVKHGPLQWAKPDCKSQVTLEYLKKNGSCVPVRAHTIVMSVQHSDDVTQKQMKADLMEHVIKAVIPSQLLDDNVKLHLQESGRFVVGGPHGDAGLTGRKIIVDTYGGWSSHGGGCFSGKDPTKVDRSGAYACRWIAKSIVNAKLAKRVEVQVSYVIGHNKPLSIFVNTFGTGKKSDIELVEIIGKNFDLRPGIIMRDLDLRRPIYQRTAVYGHFGRSDDPGEDIAGFPWEKPKPLTF